MYKAGIWLLYSVLAGQGDYQDLFDDMAFLNGHCPGILEDPNIRNLTLGSACSLWYSNSGRPAHPESGTLFC